MASSTVTGGEELALALRRYSERERVNAGAALYVEANAIKNESMARTPVDTGALRASHRVTFPEYSGQDITVKIGVGGPAAGYAIYVHEDLTAAHKVGRAKFLESALLEGLRGLAERIAQRLRGER